MRYPLHPTCPDLRRLGPTRADALLRAEAAAVAAEDAAERDRFRTLNDEEEAQQDGRGVTRRTFVAGAAATVTALATTQFVSARASFAATPGGTLVHVFLYGGLDGLSLIAPADEDDLLAKVRPDLVLPDSDSIALDRNFKLTGAFRPLEKHLKAGQLGFVPAVSDPRLSRSHFQAADACNLGGLPNETGGRGFLDSLVDVLGPGTAFRSVGIGSTLPRSLVGTNGAISLNSVGSLNLNGDGRFRDATAEAIKGLFTGINHPVEESVHAGLAALATARKLAAQGYEPAEGVTYEGVGNAFRQLAHLIKGGANVRVATIGMGGYDTHENQGTRDGGYLYRRLGELASALAAFFDDLGDKAADVTVMVSSEFGRRVAQNGSGTDHGHGGVVTVLSGRKLAGSLLGDWQGLDKLDSGDVPEFNNMFHVYGSVAQGRFGLTDAEVEKIFPRQKYTPVKLFA
ncbi:DUF1501 domain-containing protein [Polymorphospora sp. NPDC050346]|uniref:DUF1501 domain-containing protein n=1 Tax=Polymorphospora sp. NPDC050346 TaxID=3155780 RepID=UPI0033CA588D